MGGGFCGGMGPSSTLSRKDAGGPLRMFVDAVGLMPGLKSRPISRARRGQDPNDLRRDAGWSLVEDCADHRHGGRFTSHPSTMKLSKDGAPGLLRGLASRGAPYGRNRRLCRPSGELREAITHHEVVAARVGRLSGRTCLSPAFGGR